MRTLQGDVISLKMAQTAVVEVERTRTHPLYKKRVTTVKRYHVHDLVGVSLGDKVEFADTRPISKTKKWSIRKVLSKAKGPIKNFDEGQVKALVVNKTTRQNARKQSKRKKK